MNCAFTSCVVASTAGLKNVHMFFSYKACSDIIRNKKQRKQVIRGHVTENPLRFSQIQTVPLSSAYSTIMIQQTYTSIKTHIQISLLYG